MAASKMATPALTPLTKWPGGKRWLVSTLAPIWRQYPDRMLVEPFCGGLAIALGLQPRRALLNDANPHVINLYHQVQRGFLPSPDDLKYEEAHYYAMRHRFNELIIQGKHETKEAASLFFSMTCCSFNGLVRFNNSGLFNVPFGRHKSVNFTRDFLLYKQQFANWTFVNGDFERLEILRDQSLCYIDPPYDSSFTHYSSGGFDWDDQVRLAEWAASIGCPTIISNLATKRICALYRSLGFKLRYLQAPRSISCNGAREKAREVLAIKL